MNKWNIPTPPIPPSHPLSLLEGPISVTPSPYSAGCWLGWWSRAPPPSAAPLLLPQGPPAWSQTPAPLGAATRLRPGSAPPHGNDSGSCCCCGHWWRCCHPPSQQAMEGSGKQGVWTELSLTVSEQFCRTTKVFIVVKCSVHQSSHRGMFIADSLDK